MILSLATAPRYRYADALGIEALPGGFSRGVREEFEVGKDTGEPNGGDVAGGSRTGESPLGSENRDVLPKAHLSK